MSAPRTLMLLGTNQDQGQRYNRRVVFDLVRLEGAMSRTDLARRAGLSYQAVSNMADSLLEEGLLTEIRRRDGRRGQPPVELSINPEGGYSLGFSFDQRRLRGALVDLAGVPRADAEIPLGSPEPDAVLPAIATIASRFIADSGVPHDRLYGLGLSMPGVSRYGRFVGPTPASSHTWLPSWANTSIVETLREALDLAVYTDNDAAASAVGELLHGEGRHFSDFVYLYLSDGIGSGLILNRRPYRGRHGLAGEIGHMVVDVNGRPCPCGRRGCLESYASLSAAQRAVFGHASPVDPAALSRALQDGDPRMRAWVSDAARHLAQAVVSIENFLDPESIFIGGTVPENILDALFADMHPLPPRVSQAAIATSRIVKAKVGLSHSTLGAAALPMFEQTASHLSLLLKAP